MLAEAPLTKAMMTEGKQDETGDPVKHTAIQIITVQTPMRIVRCTRAAILLDGRQLDYYTVIKTGRSMDCAARRASISTSKFVDIRILTHYVYVETLISSVNVNYYHSSLAQEIHGHHT